MSPGDFRRLALALPGVVEGSHMRHPDFRVGKRVFATLGYPDDEWAMVKLSPKQQALVVATQPEIFAPVKGAWGTRGSTNVKLGAADEASVSNALRSAWQEVADRAPAASALCSWRDGSGRPRGGLASRSSTDFQKASAYDREAEERGDE